MEILQGTFIILISLLGTVGLFYLVKFSLDGATFSGAVRNLKCLLVIIAVIATFVLFWQLAVIILLVLFGILIAFR